MADILSGNNNDSGAKKLKKINKKYLVIGLIVVLVLLGAGIGYQKYDELKRENKKLSNPQEAAKLENEILKERVAKHIEVPKNETPTIATVVDATKLKNQPFFKNAENGDKVLIFPQAKRAVLYRPSTDKIIEVAPINIGKNSKNSSQQTQPTQQNDTTPTNQ